MNGCASKTIRAIDKESVHRICSGQVVLNLATAVKELVENSLDAGATIIEIRLKDFGSELIEVTDNGCGVEPKNFEGLTLKHHTSKLEDFSDLMTVETFGFRGEALSSLCALSDVSVITRHQSSSCGTHLIFDRNGIISSKASVARQVGTTVSLQNIFHSLPVRQKEFHRNLKKEFGKMTQLINAYCLISTGVRITCINQTKKGSRSTIIATQGCKSVRENIACVFGSKQLSSLLEISSEKESNVSNIAALEENGFSEQDLTVFQIKGFVSSCAHGQGRGAGDRQYYYINSRPCEPKKVIKVVNEVYHQFNQHQNPFVLLDITVSRDCVDVNVTPDKRQIFLEHEKLLIYMIKTLMLETYKNIPSTYTLNNISISSLPPKNQTNLPKLGIASTLSQWRHTLDKRSTVDDEDQKHPAKKPCLNSPLPYQQFKSPTSINENVSTSKLQDKFKQTKIIPIAPIENIYSKLKQNLGESNDVSPNTRDSNLREISDSKHCSKTPMHCKEMIKVLNNELNFIKVANTENKDIMDSNIELDTKKINNIYEELEKNKTNNEQSIKYCEYKTENIVNLIASSNDELGKQEVNKFMGCNIIEESNTESAKNVTESIEVLVDKTDVSDFTDRTSTTLDLNMDGLRKLLTNRGCRKNSKALVRFRATIDPTKNQQAEHELSREISKEMFSKMEVIGQFNLGFIIARLDSDLFIVDQHASDEKYNFETLQNSTTILNQKLVIPQQLNLTAVNEYILLENLDVFKANGFEFDIDENAQTSRKVSLTTIPMSRNWTFGKEDIDELIFMLQDAPHTFCRPSRVRAMFASRACRKSVMIGTALSHSEMKRLISNMGNIEHPWNCPHGRPTMRHLLNLDYM